MKNILAIFTGNLILLHFNGLLTVRAVRSSTQFSDISALGTLAVDVSMVLILLTFPLPIVLLRIPLLTAINQVEDYTLLQYLTRDIICLITETIIIRMQNSYTEKCNEMLFGLLNFTYNLFPIIPVIHRISERSACS